MLVPRSFKYQRRDTSDTAGRERDASLWFNNRNKHEKVKANHTQDYDRVTSTLRPNISATASAPVMPSKPLTIPARGHASMRSQSQVPRDAGTRLSLTKSDNPRRNAHQRDLPASVAALLAGTAITPPTRSARRRPRPKERSVSIDELVQEWKQDTSLRSSFGGQKSMDMLLEVVEVDDVSSVGEENYTFRKPRLAASASCDSVPSLDSDEQSLLSSSDPLTPAAVRPSSSAGLFSRKNRPRSLTNTEDCAANHPLMTHLVHDEAIIPDSAPETPLGLSSPAGAAARRTSSFKSNLTVSLQAIKTRALLSLQAFNLSPPSSFGPPPQPGQPGSSESAGGLAFFSDQTLWSHPYMFPRFSPEIRPSPFQGTPTDSQRRYLNAYALPHSDDYKQPGLDIETQQGHYRRALHSPISTDAITNAATEKESYGPVIMLQDYSKRPRSTSSSKTRNNSSSRRNPRTLSNAESEAGRGTSDRQPQHQVAAAEGAAGVVIKQREPRENSDFLRVVVLEMSMRRKGKLEDSVPGRARIWLPARRQEVSGCGGSAGAAGRSMIGDEKGRVPRRWIGVSP